MCYRSKFEKAVADDLTKRGVDVLYETEKLPYTVPSTEHTYTPDFLLTSGVYVEAKGHFDLDSRKKMLYVIESNPDKDIRILFQNPNVRLYKNSKTTYGVWCDKHNIKWAAKRIPDDWLNI